MRARRERKLPDTRPELVGWDAQDSRLDGIALHDSHFAGSVPIDLALGSSTEDRIFHVTSLVLVASQPNDLRDGRIVHCRGAIPIHVHLHIHIHIHILILDQKLLTGTIRIHASMDGIVLHDNRFAGSASSDLTLGSSTEDLRFHVTGLVVVASQPNDLRDGGIVHCRGGIHIHKHIHIHIRTGSPR